MMPHLIRVSIARKSRSPEACGYGRIGKSGRKRDGDRGHTGGRQAHYHRRKEEVGCKIIF